MQEERERLVLGVLADGERVVVDGGLAGMRRVRVAAEDAE